MPNTIFTTTTTATTTPISETYTINAGNLNAASPYYFSNSSVSAPLTTGPFNYDNNMDVDGSIRAKDIMLDGVSVGETLKKINERLSILVPDPAKLEKYAALKAAYEDYLLLEKLCHEE
jgi:hypothetical protein